MERLQICRMCLVNDAPMYVVVNKNLHELYEKLLNKPFVTEDRRPLLVCYFCCSKLKQCCRFQRKCLEAEELFAQMLDEDYEPNPLVSPKMLAFNNGFVISPMEYFDIVGECQTESQAVKEELPADCETLADIIEPKEELQVDELAAELKSPDISDVQNMPVHHSDSEDVVSITEVKTEVEEEEVTNWAPVAKKAKLHIRRTKLEDVITEEEKKNGHKDLKALWIAQNHTSKTNLKLNEPLIYTHRINNCSSVNNITLDTNLGYNGNKDDMICKISNKEAVSNGVNRLRRLCFKNQRYKCEVCKFSCNRKADLTTHIRLHTGEKPYKCEICQKCFNQKGNLNTHIRTHNAEKPYKCEVCQKSYSLKAHLTRHIWQHTDEKPHKCGVCQRSFNRKYSLSKHIRIHTGEKPYKCEVCQKSFSDKNNLMAHSRIHTGKKPYKCEVCYKSFSLKANLTAHSRLHTCEKPYTCEVCHHSFNRYKDLTTHIRIHTVEKLYKCEVCQHGFNSYKDLTTHIRIHTVEKLYKCDICQQRFIHKKTLTAHIRKHAGEKPYNCEVCQKSFSLKAHLTRHIWQHTDEKPYKCEICQRSFNRRYSLSKHIRIHTGEKPYKCEVCQKSFSDKIVIYATSAGSR